MTVAEPSETKTSTPATAKQTPDIPTKSKIYNTKIENREWSDHMSTVPRLRHSPRCPPERIRCLSGSCFFEPAQTADIIPGRLKESSGPAHPAGDRQDVASPLSPSPGHTFHSTERAVLFRLTRPRADSLGSKKAAWAGWFMFMEMAVLVGELSWHRDRLRHQHFEHNRSALGVTGNSAHC
jgi:hypothetical protein